MAERAKHSTVHICTKHRRDHLPPQQHLRNFLREFGKITALHEWSSDPTESSRGRSNNALVLFETPEVARAVLHNASLRATSSFWNTQALLAYPLERDFLDVFYDRLTGNRFSTRAKVGSSSTSTAPSRSTPDRARSDVNNSNPGSRRARSSSAHAEPPLKKARKDAPPPAPLPSGFNEASGSKLPQKPPVPTSSSATSVPRSAEWMQARIAKLENDLDASIAARNLAMSEQAVAVVAQQTEREARRQALAQKSAAEATLSRAEVEQSRLLAELDKSRQQTSSKDLESLRNQLVGVEEQMAIVQTALKQSEGKYEGRIKELEQELEESQDQSHKLRIRNSQLQESRGDADAPQLKEAQEEVERLKAELAASQEQHQSAERSFESLQRKYSKERRKHESTKEKLGLYKKRFREESLMSEQLRGSVPSALTALEGLKAVACAMGLPSLDSLGPARELKTEGEE
ncbi:hypothetical protein BDV93DRAFT_517808 [Ceratobasidium sp. AG-I]|nr:hypothetical protein BDV93DRAFT_517808 [Ceratobasidium sp. AG-I]